MHTVSLKIETLRRFIALERRWANRARCRFGGFTSVPFDFLYGRCDGCESVLRSIEKQIQRANSHKEKKQKQKSQVEAEVNMWYNFDKNVGFMASVCLFETVDGVAIGFFFFIHCSPPPPPPQPHPIRSICIWNSPPNTLPSAPKHSLSQLNLKYVWQLQCSFSFSAAILWEVLKLCLQHFWSFEKVYVIRLNFAYRLKHFK